METFQEYDFDIGYIPGKINTVADALSRRPDLKCNLISKINMSDEEKRKIQTTTAEDLGFGPIVEALRNPDEPNEISPSFLCHFTLNDNLLFYDGS